jgi:hypothetical protein
MNMNEHTDNDLKKLLLGKIDSDDYCIDPLHANEALEIHRKKSK